MSKSTTREWTEAYKILQEKKQQEQAEFNAIALKLAKQERERNRMTLKEMQAWAAFCEALPREQARPVATSHQASAAGWLLNIG